LPVENVRTENGEFIEATVRGGHRKSSKGFDGRFHHIARGDWFGGVNQAAPTAA
jgi:hypothetical protein